MKVMAATREWNWPKWTSSSTWDPSLSRQKSWDQGSALKFLNTLWKDWGYWRCWCGPWHCTAETSTLKAADTCSLISFEMTCYRCALRISWMAHRSNKSVLEEMETEWHFDHVVRSQNLSTHILEGRIDSKSLRWWKRQWWTDDIKDWMRRTLGKCTTTARERSHGECWWMHSWSLTLCKKDYTEICLHFFFFKEGTMKKDSKILILEKKQKNVK